MKNIEVKIFSPGKGSAGALEKEINEFLAELNLNGREIFDIKFTESNCSDEDSVRWSLSAMIIHEKL